MSEDGRVLWHQLEEAREGKLERHWMEEVK